MKPPKGCSKECAAWFAITAKYQRESLRLHHTYPPMGFKSDVRRRFRYRLDMLRNPAF